MPELVNITVPSCNRLELTRRTLFSLREKTRGRYLVTVVDNGSEPDVVDALERWRLDGVIDRLLKNKRNMGVAVAANQGWRSVDAAYFCKLDNDIEIKDPDWLNALLEIQQQGGFGLVSYCFFEEHKGPRKTLASGRTYISTTAINGAAVLVPRGTHEILGFWNEDYIYGWEDLEYSNRAVLAGLELAFVDNDNSLEHLGVVSRDEAGYTERKAARVDGTGLGKLFSLNLFMFEQNLRPLKVIRKFLPALDADGFYYYRQNPEYKGILARQKLLRERIVNSIDGRNVHFNMEALRALTRND